MHHKKRALTACLGAVSYLALSIGAAGEALAQSSDLPAVTVDAPNKPMVRRARPTQSASTQRTTARRATASRTTAPVVPTVSAGGQAETSFGPINGYVASRSATGTKTDTPLLQ